MASLSGSREFFQYFGCNLCWRNLTAWFVESKISGSFFCSLKIIPSFLNESAISAGSVPLSSITCENPVILILVNIKAINYFLYIHSSYLRLFHFSSPVENITKYFYFYKSKLFLFNGSCFYNGKLASRYIPEYQKPRLFRFQ